MGNRLQGKAALVTGSTSNIGRGVAIAYGREGAHVVVSGRDTQRGAEVVAEIRANGGRADFVAADLDGSAAASRALADGARSVLGGRVDILVNNAGIFPANGTLDTDEATFDRVLAVNVKAAFFLTAALVPHMTESGGGAVINLGSWAVRQGLPQGIAYTASKGALEALTRAWSAEFGSRGIRVNAISPGMVLTPDPDETTPNPVQVMMKGTPHGTTGTPEAIGQAAVYLASDESSFVHGTVLDVDGGRTAVAVIAG
ncbi:SDR family NAD(P)-dependent oxidoreductase [Streptomyces olivaceoviridis]|uniref:SDR family NAD(P)-dependent oxidoreductase n=1 Tax=Streptomyces olivaceoviridis TaxID=1921 RepID=UPI0036F96502